MSKRGIAFLGAVIALLMAIILPVAAVYVAYVAPEYEFFFFYFGVSGVAFAFISIFLFRWGHKLLVAEQLQKLLSND